MDQAQPCQVKPPPSEVQHAPHMIPKSSPSSLPTAHSLARALHTILPMGPSAGSRRKETSA